MMRAMTARDEMKMKNYEAIANAFHREALGTCFALLGDANMHMAGALSELGTSFIYTRHEHGAVAAAASFARATGKIGFASVTCGPGVTQLMTILPIAVRADLPVVVFAGEAPLRKAWYNQKIDQAPFVEACGARYFALHKPDQIISDIHHAIAVAKQQKTAVVIGVPFDLQQDLYEGVLDEALSDEICQQPILCQPQDDDIAKAAAWVESAKRPILLAGLGAVHASSHEACLALAEKAGALLATTLPAKGYFHHQDYSLGMAGGFATEAAKEIFAEADLVIAVGARLAQHAFNGGKLTPQARVIHLDIDPQTEVQGRIAADLLVKADAKLGVQALTDAITSKTGWRDDEMKAKTARALILPDDQHTDDGLLHPMAVIKALAPLIPADCHLINTSGHSAYYSAHLNQHPQSHFTVIREFGAIGNGTSFALGIAAAFADRPVILIDGDGSALMHIQELETMARHELPILTIVLNDGAYGSEVHKLRSDGVTLAGSVFGRPDFAAIGDGFGVQGHQFSALDDLPAKMAEFLTSKKPQIWDITISDTVASPQILAAHKPS